MERDYLLAQLLLEQKEIKSILKRNQKVFALFFSRLTQVVILSVTLGIGAYTFNVMTPEARSKQAENWFEKIIISGVSILALNVLQKTHEDKNKVDMANDETEKDEEEERYLIALKEIVNEYKNNRSIERHTSMDSENTKMEKNKRYN